MTITSRAADLNSAEHLALKLLAPTTAEPRSRDIAGTDVSRLRVDDARITAGSWESAVGQARRDSTDRGEFSQPVSGRMTVQQDGGEPVELTAWSSALPGHAAGSSNRALFSVGWRGTWTVHGPLCTVFVDDQA